MTAAPNMKLRKVLLLVSELHVRGFQRLRIAPGMSPSGMYWRCSIAPVHLISADHGARLIQRGWDDPLVAKYTSGQDDRYFDWPDARTTTPSGLARRFVARFPHIVEAGRGSDWSYAGWYVEMLHLTYPDLLPYCYSDGDAPGNYVRTTGPESWERDVRIPPPPPGEGRERSRFK